MKDQEKQYKAIIWRSEGTAGEHVSVMARTLEEAKRKLETEFGKGIVFNLHNEEDANRPR